MQQQVLSFWFDEVKPAQWFKSTRTLDATIGVRFAALVQQAARGELWSWRDSAEGRLAEIILLDQFTRNIYRGTAGAFAYDPIALVLSQAAIQGNTLAQLATSAQRDFLLMPCMHSESPLIHQWALSLFQQHASSGCLRAAQQHKTIIDRFGRYPQRNLALGRTSTAEEQAFLQSPRTFFSQGASASSKGRPARRTD